MKKATWCELCREKMGYKTHLLLISILHLEIERAAQAPVGDIRARLVIAKWRRTARKGKGAFVAHGFTEKEMLEKACALHCAVTKHNVHLNLAYAATQLLESTVNNSYIHN